MGESITLSGQMTTLYITDKLNTFLNDRYHTKDQEYVIYSDTDSAYIHLDILAQSFTIENDAEIVKILTKEMEEVIVPFINNACKDLAEKLNVYEVTTSVKLEKICNKAIFKGKKRYVLSYLYNEGVVYKEPKIDVTGMETVRSSTPLIIRKKLEECIKIMMTKENSDLIEVINAFRKEFDTLSFLDIGKPSGVDGIQKYYDNYKLYKKGTPMHVRASLVFNRAISQLNLTNRFELIQDHDKIKLCYLKLPNPFRENVIAAKEDLPEEFDINKFIDYNEQYEVVFLKPLRDLCNVIGWNVEENNTLEDIFG